MDPHLGRLMLLHVPSCVRYRLDAGGHFGTPFSGQCCISGDCLSALALGKGVSSVRPSRLSPLPVLHFPPSFKSSQSIQVKSRHIVTLSLVTCQS